jgi:hypothetical protein
MDHNDRSANSYPPVTPASARADVHKFGRHLAAGIAVSVLLRRRAAHGSRAARLAHKAAVTYTVASGVCVALATVMYVDITRRDRAQSAIPKPAKVPDLDFDNLSGAIYTDPVSGDTTLGYI